MVRASHILILLAVQPFCLVPRGCGIDDYIKWVTTSQVAVSNLIHNVIHTANNATGLPNEHFHGEFQQCLAWMHDWDLDKPQVPYLVTWNRVPMYIDSDSTHGTHTRSFGLGRFVLKVCDSDMKQNHLLISTFLKPSKGYWIYNNLLQLETYLDDL